MLLRMKDIIEKGTQTRLLSVFTPQSVLEMQCDLQALGYAAFGAVSRDGGNRRNSFLWNHRSDWWFR